MKTVSIMEAQHNLAKLLREVERGGELILTRHKKVVARISPIETPKPLVFPDFTARARKTWKTPWSATGSDELLRESRGDR